MSTSQSPSKMLFVFLLFFLEIVSCSKGKSDESKNKSDAANKVQTFNPVVIWIMVVSSFAGIAIGIVLLVHSCRHLYFEKKEKGNKIATSVKLVNVAVFASYIVTCIIYGVLKVDWLVYFDAKMCPFSYVLQWFSVFSNKWLVFVNFVIRIDKTFNGSSLGYNRIFLVLLVIAYSLGQIFASICIVYIGVILVKLELHKNVDTSFSFCTSKDANQSKYQQLVLSTQILYISLDTALQITLCVLFVRKLQSVIKLTENSNDRQTPSSSQHKNGRSSHDRMKRVIHKQTILVTISVMSSIIIFGAGAVVADIVLLEPVDCIINCFCVWLMFHFADPYWNRLIVTCCISSNSTTSSDHWMLQKVHILSAMPQRVFSTSPRERDNMEGRIKETQKEEVHSINEKIIPLKPVLSVFSGTSKTCEHELINRIDSTRSDSAPNIAFSSITPHTTQAEQYHFNEITLHTQQQSDLLLAHQSTQEIATQNDTIMDATQNEKKVQTKIPAVYTNVANDIAPLYDNEHEH